MSSDDDWDEFSLGMAIAMSVLYSSSCVAERPQHAVILFTSFIIHLFLVFDHCSFAFRNLSVTRKRALDHALAHEWRMGGEEAVTTATMLEFQHGMIALLKGEVRRNWEATLAYR